MTYSILAREPETGALGIAVQSKFPGVANLICHGRAGVGVIATQAFSNPDHGTRGLDLLALGVPPETVLDLLLAEDAAAGERQIAILSADGRAAQHTGEAVESWDGAASVAFGDNAIAHGNSLTSEDVPAAMVARFERGEGDFQERLIAALVAGEEAGGELRGVQSAGLQVFLAGAGYGGRQGKAVDISIYDHTDPISELSRCYRLHRLSYFGSDPDNLVQIDGKIAPYLIRLLMREGYLDPDSSNSAGIWGPEKIAAMARFMGVENYDNRIRDDDLIDTEVLSDIRARKGG
ncbi:putative Ntn-hydrolase superfamily protein [Rhodopseudomonas julia]|uniref:Ntn-hydrolase superfamily protein n=1 Tax=Rhodopseudomonas julia TaxID=200617 RepID=A0ABU0C755_9BRAD|nr:DUF1028 domain-containing protein [Rhodopseudomonas julia]MDQ0326358.1 putative Ntn-hydrolase superfamily protein [Rhodopseudomonas julia]